MTYTPPPSWHLVNQAPLYLYLSRSSSFTSTGRNSRRAMTASTKITAPTLAFRVPYQPAKKISPVAGRVDHKEKLPVALPPSRIDNIHKVPQSTALTGMIYLLPSRTTFPKPSSLSDACLDGPGIKLFFSPPIVFWCRDASYTVYKDARTDLIHST